MLVFHLENHKDLVLGAGENPQLTRSILLPVDGSETSYEAVVWANSHLINQETDNVVLIHCRQIFFPSFKPFGSAENQALAADGVSNKQDALDSESKKASHDILEHCGQVFLDSHVQVKGVSIVGEPRHTLMEYITEHKPDVVIMASHGKSALKAALMGSVSRYLVSHSPSAVTIIPPQK
ncbi:hypothetical protein HDV01_005119 [Terramyces sp. JEL0728]|nr:hypothetical protein HDV01_005119 [Terramyces sp. JEL0728]